MNISGGEFYNYIDNNYGIQILHPERQDESRTDSRISTWNSTIDDCLPKVRRTGGD